MLSLDCSMELIERGFVGLNGWIIGCCGKVQYYVSVRIRPNR